MGSEHDTPTDEQRIAALESEVADLRVGLVTVDDRINRLRQLMAKQFPYLLRKNCEFCGGQLDQRSGRCMRGCRTKMGG